MAIYRGVGGAGDISSGITLNEVTELTLRAEEAAVEAEASATAAEAAEAGVAADATAAASAKTDAQAAKTDAEAAKTAAEAAKTAAELAETNAETAQTAAELAETNAETAETGAQTAQGLAETARDAAADSAASAAGVVADATAQAVIATNQAVISTNQAGISTTKAGESNQSAIDSAASAVESSGYATDADNSAIAAAASFDEFDDRYLGSKASAPTLDNDGNALLTGALYWNSTSSNLWVYNGSAWEQATLTAGDFLSSSDIGVSVQAYDATIVVDADIGVSVQAYDADTTKNDVANTFTAAQTFGASVVEKKVAMGANDIDLSAGNYFTYTLSGAQTLTVSNVASSGSVSAFVLEVTNGGSAALSYFSGVTWAAATAPTLTAAGVDTLAFFTHDGGTTWRGFVLGLGMAGA